MRLVVSLVLTLAIAAGTSAAQRRGGRFGQQMAVATPESFDGSFQFCRVAFRGNPNGDGGGWGVDWPQADRNLSIRLSELTKTRVGVDAQREPKHVIVRLTDETLFQCPFIMMTEVGAAYFDEAEAAALRAYLLKGGFLWADDFWGTYAWRAWMEQWGKVLSPVEYPVTDLPLDHPLFRAQFKVNAVPQIASINFWAGSGGGTSERGADSAEPHLRVVTDTRARIMAVMTHNTDLGDSFEREAENPQYFLQFSVPGYALGIDILLYSMTH